MTTIVGVDVVEGYHRRVAVGGVVGDDGVGVVVLGRHGDRVGLGVAGVAADRAAEGAGDGLAGGEDREANREGARIGALACEAGGRCRNRRPNRVLEGRQRDRIRRTAGVFAYG